MGKGIRISEKHGLNPSLTCCPFCGKETGIALFGRLKGDAEAPKRVAGEPCDDCKKVLDADGLIVIEVRDGESGKNPYRTGRLVGVNKDARERLNCTENVCYMHQSMFSKLFNDLI